MKGNQTQHRTGIGEVTGTGVGNRVAPPRFIVYVLALAAVFAAALSAEAHHARVFMLGFDAATLLFLLSFVPLVRDATPAVMARHARANDANRGWLLATAFALSVAIMVVIAGEMHGGAAHQPWTVPLILVTLALAWLSGNVIYALHYAHIYYTRPPSGGGDYARGLGFPGDEEPDYTDFLNFALVLGMTFQTADITITSRQVRRITTLHCMAAFVFNLGILGFTINILAST